MIKSTEMNYELELLTENYKLYKWYKDKWFLFFSYRVDHLSTVQIGKLLGCNHNTIINWLRKFNIPIRTISEYHKGKKRTDETKKKMSISSKEVWNRPGYKEKHRNASIGYKHSEEAKRKMSKAHIDIKSWNKGIPHSEITKIKMSKSHIGMKHSEESKKKMSKKGEKHPLYGKHPSEETKKKISKKRIEYMQTHRGHFKDTGIEVILQNFLKELDIEFETQKLIKIKPSHSVDLYIPSLNLVIEADGIWWHGHPKFEPLKEHQIKQKKRDKIQTEKMVKLGYKVLRLWGSEIKKLTLNEFKNILNKYEVI